MRIGRFLGVGFRVNNLFLLVMLLAGLTGRLEQMLLLFLAVFLHELGHVAAARSRGLSVREIELLPFGGVAKVEDFLELDPDIERAVALAGPCTNFFLAGGLLLAKKYGLLERSQADFLLGCNLVVAAFNLIPALPLDGGRIYRAHLVGKMGFRRATERAAAVGKVMAAFLALAGAVGVYLGYVNISLVVLSFFIYYAADRERQLAGYVFLRYLMRKKKELQEKGVLLAQPLVARQGAPVREVLRCFIPRRYHLVFVLAEEAQVKGFVTEVEVVEAFFNRGTDLTIRELPLHPL